MPKIIGHVGTGMTERGVVRFETEDPGNIPGLVAAGIHALDMSSFERLSRRLCTLARRILDQAGLPFDPDGAYLVTADGAWADVTGDSELEDSIRFPLAAAVQGCGYPPDSPQGYAARLLTLFAAARQQLGAGNQDGAMALAFAAGELVNEAGMKDLFEKDALVGEKVREGGREGQARRHGTVEEQRALYCRIFDDLLAKRMSRTEAYERVARQFRTSARTIRRAVTERDRSR